MNESLFTDNEYTDLIQAACSGEPASEEQIRWFLNQCEEMRIGALTLELILHNKVLISNITEDDFRMKKCVQDDQPS
jgi:hypothetical protein